MLLLAFGVIAALAEVVEIANKEVGRDNEGEDYALENCKAEAVYVKKCVAAGDKTEKYQRAWYDEIIADGGWLSKLTKIERSDCKALEQEQFRPGKEPLTITKPGCYYLKEDIEVDFGPVYEMKGAGKIESPLHHGFPYAIRILGENVRIDLNNKTIKMSPSYFRLQPFMSIFDLGEFPFPKARGGYPQIKKSGKNVLIHNGTIGRASHFGIHGNQNVGVVIRDVKIQHFAVAGIMFNTAKNVSVEHVVVDNDGHKADTDVSYGLILELYRRVQLFKSKGSVCADLLSAIKLYARNEMDKMLQDTDFLDALKNPGEGHTARSDGTDPQGNIYGIYFAAEMNVLKIADSQRDYNNLGDSANIRIMDVQVRNIAKGAAEAKSVWFGDAQNNINEVIQPSDWNGHLHDYDAVCDDDDKFKEKSLESKIAVWRMVFTECFVPNKFWKDQGMDGQYKDFRDQVLATLAQRKNGFKKGTKCRKVEGQNGGIRPLSGFDVAGHKSKPLIGIRIDQVKNVLISHTTVEGLHNKGPHGRRTIIGENAYLATPPVWQSSAHTTFLFRGNWAYGITLSGCHKANVQHTAVRNIKSDKGSVVGVAFMGENVYVDIHNVMANELTINEDPSATVPNMVPITIPFYQDFLSSTLVMSTISPNYVYKFTGKDCQQINEQITPECQEIVGTKAAECGNVPELKIPACKADSACSGKPAVIEEDDDGTIGGKSSGPLPVCVDMQLSFSADDSSSVEDASFEKVLKQSIATAADVSVSDVSLEFENAEKSSFSVRAAFELESLDARSSLVDIFYDQKLLEEFVTSLESGINSGQDGVVINSSDVSLCPEDGEQKAADKTGEDSLSSVIIFIVVGAIVLVTSALVAFYFHKRHRAQCRALSLSQQRELQKSRLGPSSPRGKNVFSSNGGSSRGKSGKGGSSHAKKSLSSVSSSKSKRSKLSKDNTRHHGSSGRKGRGHRGLE